MRGSFRSLDKGDRVLVRYESRAVLKLGVETFGGSILSDGGDGTFLVLYDDGTREACVPRHRIRRADPGPWQIVYYGPENHYAVESLIPGTLIASEPGIAVECTFMHACSVVRACLAN